MKVELHIIQSFAPACLNRDDTNAVKDCEFGLHRRVRVSSQCIKRSVRTSPVFTDRVKGHTAVRTKLLIQLLTDRMLEMAMNKQQVEQVVPLFVSQYVGLDATGKTKVLLYLGNDEIQRIAAKLHEHWDKLAEAAAQVANSEKGDKRSLAVFSQMAKDVQSSAVGATKAADIALFGRMVAESPKDNVDAACQVAHAISTHRANMEMDFYTAVDDLSNESGAGMMGTTEFASACFYRYSLVDLDQLVSNLQGDRDLALRTLEAYLLSSILAIPTGKQTSTAPQSPPSFVMVVVRDSGSPQSLVNAFERPVYPSQTRGVVEQSILRLDDYWGRLARMYGTDGIRLLAHCMVKDVTLKNLHAGAVESIWELVDGVKEALA
jgi:CRISPR system Cascade subunit CasC